MNELIVLFDIIGSIGFLLAFIYSVKNRKQIDPLTSWWSIFNVASFMGFFWSLTVTMEWLNVFPLAMDEIQPVLLSGLGASLTILAIVTVLSVIQPIE